MKDKTLRASPRKKMRTLYLNWYEAGAGGVEKATGYAYPTKAEADYALGFEGIRHKIQIPAPRPTKKSRGRVTGGSDK
jgi:hypothetical protein